MALPITNGKVIENQKLALINSTDRHLSNKNNQLNDEDWTYINAILKSNFGGLYNLQTPTHLKFPIFTPECAHKRVPAPIDTSEEFNQKFNQNFDNLQKQTRNRQLLCKLQRRRFCFTDGLLFRRGRRKLTGGLLFRWRGLQFRWRTWWRSHPEDNL